MCREAWTQLMINPSGDVITCDAAGDLRETILNKETFMDLWNSPYFVEIRKRLLKGNSACSNFCIRANQASINKYNSHFITRGKTQEEIDKFMEGVEEDNNVYVNKRIEEHKDTKQTVVVNLYIMQGWRYVKENDTEKIKEICNLLMDLYDIAEDKDKVNICVFVGRVNIDLKKLEIAKEYLLKAMALDKSNPVLYKLMAIAEFHLKEYKKAEKLFFKAVRLAKKIKNNFEISEIYFEMSTHYDMNYVYNKRNIMKQIYKHTMEILLKKSLKYNSDNTATLNKLEEIKNV
jgi:tetratricopeptide (TPR) repeat protein